MCFQARILHRQAALSLSKRRRGASRAANLLAAGRWCSGPNPVHTDQHPPAQGGESRPALLGRVNFVARSDS
eukprot:362927-Prymnesium_polylepis.2